MSNYSLNERLDKISDQLFSLEEAVRENRASVAELERVAGLSAIAAGLSEKNEAGGHRRNLAILAGFLLIAVLGFAGWRSNDARASDSERALAAAKASTADARLSACRAYNADVADRINSMLTGLAATSKDPGTAEQLVAQFLLPRRSCTSDGLAAYFSTPQGPAAYESAPTVPTTTTQPGG